MVVWYPKTNAMKPPPISREILLIDATTFSKKELRKLNPSGCNDGKDSLKKQLQKVCLAGSLCKILPEITRNTTIGDSLAIWDMLAGENFLVIRQGDIPDFIEPRNSVDPYLFLPAMHFN